MLAEHQHQSLPDSSSWNTGTFACHRKERSFPVVIHNADLDHVPKYTWGSVGGGVGGGGFGWGFSALPDKMLSLSKWKKRVMVFLTIATSLLPMLLDQNKRINMLFGFLYSWVIKQFTEGKHEISLRKSPPPPPFPSTRSFILLMNC